MPRRVYFLDRDGTLIVNRHYLNNPEEVELLPTVREALKAAVDRGDWLFLLTNQSGIGRGLMSPLDVGACNQRMIKLIGLGLAVFKGVCVAPERPDEPVVYRKPSPRYIHEMMMRHRLKSEQCVMIGDTPVDWKAGLNAGITSRAVRSPDTAKHEAELKALGVPVFDTLAEAMAEPE